MAQILDLTNDEAAQFFDVAAAERNEVPADIVESLYDIEIKKTLRTKIDYKTLLKMGEIENG